MSTQLMRSMFLGAVLVVTSGCSLLADKALDLVGGPSSGLEVDANAGQAKTEGDDSVAQQANTAVSVAGGNTEENFEGPIGQVINEAGLEIHELILLVLLAGWAIPSPTEMLQGFVRAVRRSWLLAVGRID